MEAVLDVEMLQNFGGIIRNDLLRVINEHLEAGDEDNEQLQLQASHYCTPDGLIDTLSKCPPDSFSVLTLNCQSLNAKFD